METKYLVLAFSLLSIATITTADEVATKKCKSRKFFA